MTGISRHDLFQAMKLSTVHGITVAEALTLVYEPKRLYFIGGWIPGPQFHIIDAVCGKPFVDYFGLTIPNPADYVAPTIVNHLLRHIDGRVVRLGEPMRCDSCHGHYDYGLLGKKLPIEISFPLHPNNFVRPAEYARNLLG